MPDVLTSIKALVEWQPVLQILSQLSAAKDTAQRASLWVKLLQKLAARTPSPADDALLEKLDAVLKTPAGADLFEFLLSAVTHLATMEPPHA
ncbi:MAG: hypothetical protein EBR88_00115 [Betaproteobacteria bacterium]|nr:hypothetical protein [Betaproteobacteria bacterium]